MTRRRVHSTTAADVVAELKRPASFWRKTDPSLRRLVVVGFIEHLSADSYFSLIVPLAKTLGLDSRSVGTLTLLLQVTAALTAAAAGVMADRGGRKTVYVTGQCIRVAITLVLLTTHSYFGLAIVFVLRGLCSIQGPAQQAMLADFTHRGNRATILAVSQMLTELASVLMPIASGAIADTYGTRASFAVGLVLAAVAVGIGRGLREKPAVIFDVVARQEGHPAMAAPHAAGRREPLAQGVRRMLSGKRGPSLILLLAAGVCNGLSSGALGILLPFTVMDRFSSAYTAVASADSVVAFGTVLVLLIGGRMADMGGRRRIILTTGMMFPLFMLSVFFINSLWQLEIILVITSMIGSIRSPAISAVYLEAVDDCDRAAFSGLQLSLNIGGMALGSVLAGIGYRLTPDWSWGAMLATWAIQVVLYYFALPHDGWHAGSSRFETAS